MRIWDFPVQALCRQHLLGEHRELHVIWTILTRREMSTSGYANHPETKRWRGHLLALYNRHAVQVDEMHARGYRHQSPLECPNASNKDRVRDNLWYPSTRISTSWPSSWQSLEHQFKWLKSKRCACNVRLVKQYVEEHHESTH